MNADHLYLENLPKETTETELAELCAGYGHVDWTHIIREPGTHESRGIGLVEMESADSACHALNNREHRGRIIRAFEIPASPTTDNLEFGRAQHRGGDPRMTHL